MVAKETHHVVEAVGARNHMPPPCGDATKPTVVAHIAAHVNRRKAAHVGHQKLRVIRCVRFREYSEKNHCDNHVQMSGELAVHGTCLLPLRRLA